MYHTIVTVTLPSGDGSGAAGFGEVGEAPPQLDQRRLVERMQIDLLAASRPWRPPEPERWR
jgi:hypothetical protein